MPMSFETERVPEVEEDAAEDSITHTEMISAPEAAPETARMSGQMTEYLTDQIPEPETEGVTESVEEDGDVLVLLPDEPAFVETQEVAQVPIEDIPLKTTNPLAGTEEIPSGVEVNPFSGGAVPAAAATSSPRSEKIGVIDEIAELATSLDQDILSADERPAPVETLGEPPPAPAPRRAFPAARGRRKRSKVLVLTGTLAAAVLIGLFVVAELKGWLRSGPTAGGVATASGKGVKKSGTPTTKVSSIKTPIEKVQGGPGTHGGQTGVDGGNMAPPELSVTRIAVRQKVRAAVQLGLLGLAKKE
jgi:hypothetical protein